MHTRALLMLAALTVPAAIALNAGQNLATATGPRAFAERSAACGLPEMP